jgi:Lon protease-like protein
MRPTRIPLFPLEVVLLPGMPLPLHIFEPRYRKMIGLCLADKREFGMILAQEKQLATVGCTAEVVQKLKDYEDGRMDILSEGRAVFHLSEVLDEEEYYEGIVEYLPDDPDAPDAAKEKQLFELFERVQKTMQGEQRISLAKNEVPLAYRLAAQLPLDLPEKQHLLEMREEGARREFLLKWMNETLPRLLRTQRVRHLAGGNGHGAK